MRRGRWRIAVVAAGLSASWGLGVGAVTEAGESPAARSSTADPAGDARLARLHRQRLTWHRCQQGPRDTEGQALDAAGAQCAEVTVPLDYSRPDWRTIAVVVSRLRASDPAARIGALVINLGGPAIPALGIVPLARQAMGATGARFDLIGMDRRFVGRHGDVLPYASTADDRYQLGGTAAAAMSTMDRINRTSATLQVLAQAADGGTAQPTPELDATLTDLLTDASGAKRSAMAAIMCADATVLPDRDLTCARPET